MNSGASAELYARATGGGASPAAVALRRVRDQKQYNHTLYGWYILAGVIGFFTFVRILRYTWEKLSLSAQFQPSTELEKRDFEHAHRRVRRASVLQRLVWALATGFRITFFRWTIRIAPGCMFSISEMTFITGYIAVNLLLLFLDTMNLLPMMYQDRAAGLASSQLALVVALAGKNNVISWLTGIGHEKLNVLHRAAARTGFILLWIHAIQRILSGLPPQFDFSHDWMRAGAAGLGALTLATILSVGPIRHAAFEFFLVTHILLVLVFLVCGWYHAKAVEHGSLIYPALIVWGFDRFLRLGRLAWNNKIWDAKHPGDVLVEAISDDTVRLTLRRRGVSWRPGQHAYVILPTVSKLPFEAHPFTIASIPEVVNDKNERDIVFLVRGRTGFTGRLRKRAREGGQIRVPALLDGPYGSPPNLHVFSTCVLVAGGSGVSYTLPLFLDLVRAHKAGKKTAVKRVVFVWVLRDPVHVKWISETLAKSLTSTDPSLVIEPKIYVTGTEHALLDLPVLSSNQRVGDWDAMSSKSEKTDESGHRLELPKHTHSPFKVNHGRPSMKNLLRDEIGAAVGPISVDVAGPSSLADSIRSALCTDLASPGSVIKGAQPVTLHVETFGMVKT